MGAPDLAVALRFAIASALIFLWMILWKRRIRFSWREHLWFALLGGVNFGLNFRLTYRAGALIPSGVVAFTFTLVPYFSMVALRVIYGQAFRARLLVAALLGVVGLGLIYGPDLWSQDWGSRSLDGALFALAAAVAASVGGIIALEVRKKKLPIMEGNAWAMFYGSLMVVASIVIESQPLNYEWTVASSFSLLHLAIFGSVVAYSLYFRLIEQIGIDRASYVNVITPIIAILVSTFFEGFTWTGIKILGVLSCLWGSYLVLKKPRNIKTCGT